MEPSSTAQRQPLVAAAVVAAVLLLLLSQLCRGAAGLEPSAAEPLPAPPAALQPRDLLAPAPSARLLCCPGARSLPLAEEELEGEAPQGAPALLPPRSLPEDPNAKCLRVFLSLLCPPFAGCPLGLCYYRLRCSSCCAEVVSRDERQEQSKQQSCCALRLAAPLFCASSCWQGQNQLPPPFFSCCLFSLLRLF